MTTAPATASIIRQQITPGVLMSLGAHKLGCYTDERGQDSFVFAARVLPFNPKGERLETPRIMRVMITLNVADLYDVRVQYKRRGQLVTHFEAINVYADNLPVTLLAVDSDGDLSESSTGHRNRVD